MTPIYAVSGWALIIAISAQLSASMEHRAEGNTAGREQPRDKLGTGGQEAVSLSVIRYSLFVIREMSDYE